MHPGLSASLLLALLVAGSAGVSAQDRDALTERIAASIAMQEPEWRLVERFAPPPGPSIYPVVRGRWAADGSLSIAITVFDSSADASEQLSVRELALSNDRTRRAVEGYGDRAFRRSGEIAFQKFNLLVVVRGDPATTLHRAAALVDAAIVRDLVISECVDELLPRRLPTSGNIVTQLFLAAESGCIADIQSALGRGANANARFDDESVLSAAIRRQHVEAVRLLLKSGADPTVREAGGTTALWAVLRTPDACCSTNRPRSRIQSDRLAIVDALAAAGADINTRRADGRTILLDAMRDPYWNDREFLAGLLARGASARLRDQGGDTALTLLFSYTNHTQLPGDERIPLLVAAGTDVNATGRRGMTALELVRQASRQYRHDLSGVTEILITGGAR